MSIVVFDGAIKTAAYTGKVKGYLFPGRICNDLFVRHDTDDSDDCLAGNDEFIAALVDLVEAQIGIRFKTSNFSRAELGMQEDTCAVFEGHPFRDNMDKVLDACGLDKEYACTWGKSKNDNSWFV